MGFIKDFKEFALKGNVVDMAVGVIIGGAFGKIVTSIVSNIIMPPIGVLLGGVDFTELKVTLKEAVTEGETVTEAVTLNYGQFIQDVVDFLIIALCIFLMIKGITKLTAKKEEPAPEEPAAPAAPTQEELLTEIRDLLAKKK
ncbi:MAG: large-conductance mechanosensitive channel protein MscL [Bacteroidaceae bacterium]|nr:large-conductance mechanosensitive channel protein MscL [Bacteroidaceae bacterium]